MCGGGGGGSDRALKYQKQQDEARRQRIQSGETQLRQLFNNLRGGHYTGEAVNAAGGMSYDDYASTIKKILRDNRDTRQTGSQVILERGPMNPTVRAPTYEQYLTKAGRQQLMDLGLRADQIGSLKAKDYLDLYGSEDWFAPGTAKMVDPIWKQHGQAYLDFANPQLDRQFGDAREDLTYALARQGQLKGSIAADRRTDLETSYGERQQDVAQTALGYENQARQDLANYEQNAYQMLNSTANPGSTLQTARSNLSSLREMPALSPLGAMFQNATAGLAGAVPAYNSGRETANVQNIVYSRDPNKGSGSVVR